MIPLFFNYFNERINYMITAFLWSQFKSDLYLQLKSYTMKTIIPSSQFVFDSNFIGYANKILLTESHWEDIKNPSEIIKKISFFELFLDIKKGQKLFYFFQDCELIVIINANSFQLNARAQGKVKAIVSLVRVLIRRKYLKRISRTEVGTYFLKAFSLREKSIQMFYGKKWDDASKYDTIWDDAINDFEKRGL